MYRRGWGCDHWWWSDLGIDHLPKNQWCEFVVVVARPQLTSKLLVPTTLILKKKLGSCCFNLTLWPHSFIYILNGLFQNLSWLYNLTHLLLSLKFWEFFMNLLLCSDWYNDACLFAIMSIKHDGAKITNANPQNLDDSNNDVISLIMVQAWVSVK